ncbi:ChuX/HutX family heme-like substrate-binding protein [Fulvivirgaceae bacterium BMA10]|uniref:ChuX/HutX family heme-like substrate-binding protein n=1 Tax=Splendidivirga corallicola TaxID=3051826 RepID=A0ABT8KX47_9BACT|nr:ChuX/HutX family heme-like substrate-binding protein [Fulvivirgaceae bacterium BMA10]
MENLTIENTTKRSENLKQAWNGIKKAKPHIRIREAANALDCSEAELVATTVGETAIRLEGDWQKLMKRLPTLGYVMSLTRNESCVLEHKGEFEKVNTFGKEDHAMATVIGSIETRVFFKAWHVGFAIKQETPRGLMQSIQIFDQSGTAVTKIFLQPKSDQEAFDQLVLDFKSENQSQEQLVTFPESIFYRTIGQVDKEGLLSEWRTLKDTHDFFGMLRRYEVNRRDALELAKGEFTYQVAKASVQTILEQASGEKLPIMIFVGNKGNIQIHQSTVNKIKVMDHWLNVLDPEFNMHLREDHIDTAWVVEKPTEDGPVTSLELFDKDKNQIASFFGLRKPGQTELTTWRALLEKLPKL